jgi:hypothetical protein
MFAIGLMLSDLFSLLELFQVHPRSKLSSLYLGWRRSDAASMLVLWVALTSPTMKWTLASPSEP